MNATNNLGTVVGEQESHTISEYQLTEFLLIIEEDIYIYIIYIMDITLIITEKSHAHDINQIIKLIKHYQSWYKLALHASS